MARWLSTGQAADLLGTSTATVRALVCSGEIAGASEIRNVRKRWRVDAESVEAYLAERGRIDKRRRRDSSEELASLLSELLAELKQRSGAGTVSAGTGDQPAQLAALSDIVLRQRARAQAIEDAERHQAEAIEHLTAAVKAQSEAASALRRALSEADDSLGELLIPSFVSEPENK